MRVDLRAGILLTRIGRVLTYRTSELSHVEGSRLPSMTGRCGRPTSHQWFAAHDVNAASTIPSNNRRTHRPLLGAGCHRRSSSAPLIRPPILTFHRSAATRWGLKDQVSHTCHPIPRMRSRSLPCRTKSRPLGSSMRRERRSESRHGLRLVPRTVLLQPRCTPRATESHDLLPCVSFVSSSAAHTTPQGPAPSRRAEPVRHYVVTCYAAVAQGEQARASRRGHRGR